MQTNSSETSGHNIVTRTAAGTCTTCGGTTAHWLPTNRATAAEQQADDLAAEQSYQELLAHPERTVDAFGLFDTPLCRAQGTRNRVCGAYVGHTGAHDFVPASVRED